jgi:hypothetical protein
MIFLKTAILVIMTLACEIKSDPLVFWFQEHPFSPKRPLLPICLYRNDVEKILGITGFEEACGPNGSSVFYPEYQLSISYQNGKVSDIQIFGKSETKFSRR